MNRPPGTLKEGRSPTSDQGGLWVRVLPGAPVHSCSRSGAFLRRFRARTHVVGHRRSLLEWAVMFVKRICGISLPVLTLVIPLILAAAACGGDGEEAPTPDGAEASPTVPVATPTADDVQPSPTTSGNSVISAVTAYVTETGLDGETFEVTNPINCNAFPDVPEEDAPVGQICINFNNSDFGDISGVIEVWAYGTDSRWKLALELQNMSWVVTGAEDATTEGDEE